jgi:hypothetical protein
MQLLPPDLPVGNPPQKHERGEECRPLLFPVTEVNPDRDGQGRESGQKGGEKEPHQRILAMAWRRER